MNEYGKLNGVPIEPGEGWEIVPLECPLESGHYVLREGDAWLEGFFWLGHLVMTAVFNDPRILAFRRPKTVQAGQGESGAAKLEPSGFTTISNVERRINETTISELFKAVETLRALTAAQAVALDAAGMALHKAQDYLWRSVQSKDKRGQRVFDAVSKALTLISAAKEVGK